MLLLATLAMMASGQGWVGQGRVTARDSAACELVPCVVVDEGNVPWAVWSSVEHNRSLVYAFWSGESWETLGVAVPHEPGTEDQLRPSLCADGAGDLRLVWCDAYRNNTDDIGSSRWDGSSWSERVQVNTPDSTELDFAPKVACGGGQVWCVWYGGPTDMSPYSIFASRWNDSSGRWDGETQVSPADGDSHWWCDLAVDTLGTPHVVWCTYPLYTVFYSYFDGQRWVAPIPVNDTAQVTASPWADPRIVIDRTGMMHVSFTGARAGALHRDIFYARNDGSGWSPCQMVTQDSLYDEWYSDIAADSPDNVWVTWDRQNEGADQFRVYASLYDGYKWSPEERLDDTSSYGDRGTNVCFDGFGSPWVVWNGQDYGTDAWQVFYNRYGWVGISEEGRRPMSVGSPGTLIWKLLTSGAEFSYALAVPARVELALFDGAGRLIRTLVDGQEQSGRHAVRWNGRGADGKPVASGTYFCRLTTGDKSDVCKAVFVTRAKQGR